MPCLWQGMVVKDFMFALSEQRGKQGYKCRSDKDDAAASHELFYALGFCAGVIIAVAFKQVYYTPHAKACADCNYKGLKNGDR